MFGTYRYGSDLLNVTFDPTRAEELASYGWDDDGSKAEKVHLIRNGILQRPLGGAISQARAGLPGTSNSRADGWNRPPIDRMANLNLEPGTATLDGNDRRHRARRADGNELLVVDRRLAQQVPVRLRARPLDRERHARRGRQEPELPRHQRELLAQPRARRQRRNDAGARHAVLRQRRARRRRSASATRRRRACSPASTSSEEKEPPSEPHTFALQGPNADACQTRDEGRSQYYDAEERGDAGAAFGSSPKGRGFSGGLLCRSACEGTHPSLRLASRIPSRRLPVASACGSLGGSMMAPRESTVGRETMETYFHDLVDSARRARRRPARRTSPGTPARNPISSG